MANPRSVVCIPTLKRTEFLALTLERLSQTREAEHLDVRIFVDWGINGRYEDVAYVRDTYLPTADIYQANPHVSVLSGTWNILMALKDGYESGADYIFLVEEDVMVRPNFFQWHWATQASDDYFVTCGRRHFRMPVDFYSNPGTCYRREKLAMVIPHINDEYFAGTDKYVDKHWPQFRGQDGSLDDGMIRKILKSVNGKAMCAVPPVAHHQGFRFYNRMDGFVNHGKTIQEKIESLREIVSRIDPTFRYTQDFEPFV